jgi:hypothetical protein
MKSTHTATLDIPQLSRVSKAAHVFPAMEKNSLFSVGQLCDEGYSVLFNTNGVKILNQKQEIIMKGSRDHATGLWRINLLQTNPTCNVSQPPSQPHTVNNVYALRNSGALVNYLHKEMFSCTKSALVHAIKKGHLTTWPGLTVEAVNKHLKLTPATAMGHMNQRHQNTRSTKPKLITQDDENITPLGSEEKKHLVFALVLDHGQVYTDLTEAFPTRSSRGNSGMMIYYSYDANYIRPIAMKSKSGAEWVRAFGVVFEEMLAKGVKPRLQTMDNEASAALKKNSRKINELSTHPPPLSPNQCG